MPLIPGKAMNWTELIKEEKVLNNVKAKQNWSTVPNLKTTTTTIITIRIKIRIDFDFQVC